MIYNLFLAIPWGIIEYLDTNNLLLSLLFFIAILIVLKSMELKIEEEDVMERKSFSEKQSVFKGRFALLNKTPYNKMKNKIITASVLSALLLGSGGFALATDIGTDEIITSSVTSSVTASFSVSGNSFDFGTMDLGQWKQMDGGNGIEVRNTGALTLDIYTRLNTLPTRNGSSTTYQWGLKDSEPGVDDIDTCKIAPTQGGAYLNLVDSYIDREALGVNATYNHQQTFYMPQAVSQVPGTMIYDISLIAVLN